MQPCLDTSCTIDPASSCFDEDGSNFPLPLRKIPPTVSNFEECAKWEITTLLEKEHNNSLTLEEEDALDDGFVICDLNVVRRKLHVWNEIFPNVHPYFALKCNPDPMVATVIAMAGGGFDCASVPEIECALRAHKSVKRSEMARRIVYANPQRAEQHLEKALVENVCALTFDGPEELLKIHRIYQRICEEYDDSSEREPPQRPQVILRIFVPDEHSTVPLGEKFGASLDQVPDLTVLACDLDLPLIGVSFHCGSGNHDPESYRQAILLAKSAMVAMDRILAQRDLDPCWLLDIGGGFPGVDGLGGDQDRFCGDSNRRAPPMASTREQDSAAAIAQVVSPMLRKLFPPEETKVYAISEPGRYFVEAAFILCSRIYRMQVVNEERHYFIAQGVQGVFKDVLLCNESFLPIPVLLDRDVSTDDATSRRVKSVVHGPSGESYDTIYIGEGLPELKLGDWLLFDRIGAYTLSIAARNGRPPVRYVYGAS